jgi:uncharacterized protein (DUF58 family)
MPGDVRSTSLGEGTEFAQVREYRPGDDVRRIDWNVTARTGEPHVRLHVAERALTTWALVDVSPSMAFGTQQRTKADVAGGVLLALAHLSTTGANRLGIIAFDAMPWLSLPPTGDRRAVLRAVQTTAARPRAVGAQTAFTSALDLTARVCRRPGAVVVVSDFRGPIVWRRALARVAQRHHVLAVEIVDEREQRLVSAGELILADPETGRQVRVDTSDERLRKRFAQAAEAERMAVRRAIAAAGCERVVLDTSGDWLRQLASHLDPRRRRR